MTTRTRANLENIGAQVPELGKTFTVRTRTSGDLMQLMMADVFNNANLVFDVAKDGTMTLDGNSDGADTGIANPRLEDNPDHYYPTLHLNTRSIPGGRYYRASGQIQLFTLDFWIAPNASITNTGLPVTIIYINSDHVGGYDNYWFGLDKASFNLTSGQSEVEVTVTKSEHVDFYRVVELDTYALSGWNKNDYMVLNPGPEATLPWRDLRTDKFTMQCQEAYNSCVVIPFDKDGIPASPSEGVNATRNIYPEGNWRPLGTGKLKDLIAYSFLKQEAAGKYQPPFEPAEVEVEVEICDSPIPMIRIKNPFGAAHPLHNDIIAAENQQEPFYINFDISDPLRVVVPQYPCGLEYEGQWPLLNCSNWCLLKGGVTADEIDRDFANNTEFWGTFDGSRVVMPKNSMSYGSNDGDDMVLELPGFVECSFTLGDAEEDEHQMFRTDITEKSDNIETFVSYLVSSKDADKFRNQASMLAKHVIESSEYEPAGVSMYGDNQRITLMLPVEDASYGLSQWLVIPIVGGEPVYSQTRMTALSKVRDLEEWEVVRKFLVHVIDDLTLNMMREVGFTVGMVDLDVVAWENPDVKDVYLLPDYFKHVCEYSGFDQNHFYPEEADYFVINARDPNKVFVSNDLNGKANGKGINTGIQPLKGSSYFRLLNAINLEKPLNRYGRATWSDDRRQGSITASSSVHNVRYDESSGDVIRSRGGYLQLNFDETSGVESVTTDGDAAAADAPVEWYNLQGVRVVNPQGGIFIRRQGAKVEKVAIR